MKSHTDILQTLSEIAPDDREWILRSLSVRERKALLDGSMAAPASSNGASPPTAHIASPPAMPDLPSDPIVIGRALTREPAWVTYCVVARREGVGAAVRSQLSAPQRLIVERFESAASPPPQRVVRRVNELLAEAARRSSPEGDIDDSKNWFGRLASRWRNRGRTL